MRNLLRKPAVNAVCLCLFTAFYSIVFISSSMDAGFKDALFFADSAATGAFWPVWSGFLYNGHHAYIAYALVAVTVLIVILLLTRRRPYDEYHTANLVNCLAVAAVLTLIAIAWFFLAVLGDASGIIEKFSLFIVIHWSTVVLADLAYVLVSRWG